MKCLSFVCSSIFYIFVGFTSAEAVESYVLTPSIACEDVLVKRRYQLEFASSIPQLSLKNKTIEGPFYVLGIDENNRLRLVKHDKDEFYSLDAKQIIVLNADSKLPLAPPLASLHEQCGETCAGNAVVNFLRQLKAMGEISFTLDNENEEKAIRVADPRYTHQSWLISNMLKHLEVPHKYLSGYGMWPSTKQHLKENGLAIYMYDGNQQYRIPTRHFDISNNKLKSRKEDHPIYLYDPESKKSTKGHAILVRGILPDNRVVVAHWQEWQVWDEKKWLSELTLGRTSFQFYPGKRLFLSDEIERLKAQQISLKAGDSIELTIRTYRQEYQSIKGTILFCHYDDDGKVDSLEVWDEVQNKILYLASPFSDYYLAKPLQLTSYPKAAKDIRVQYVGRNLTLVFSRKLEPRPALFRIPQGYHSFLYKLGFVYNKNNRLLIRFADESHFHKPDRDVYSITYNLDQLPEAFTKVEGLISKEFYDLFP